MAGKRYVRESFDQKCDKRDRIRRENFMNHGLLNGVENRKSMLDLLNFTRSNGVMDIDENVLQSFGMSMSDFVMSGISDYIADSALPEILRRDMLDRDLKSLIDVDDEKKLKKTRQRTYDYEANNNKVFQNTNDAIDVEIIDN